MNSVLVLGDDNEKSIKRWLLKTGEKTCSLFIPSFDLAFGIECHSVLLITNRRCDMCIWWCDESEKHYQLCSSITRAVVTLYHAEIGSEENGNCLLCDKDSSKIRSAELSVANSQYFRRFCELNAIQNQTLARICGPLGKASSTCKHHGPSNISQRSLKKILTPILLI